MKQLPYIKAQARKSYHSAHVPCQMKYMYAPRIPTNASRINIKQNTKTVTAFHTDGLKGQHSVLCVMMFPFDTVALHRRNPCLNLVPMNYY